MTTMDMIDEHTKIALDSIREAISGNRMLRMPCEEDIHIEGTRIVVITYAGNGKEELTLGEYMRKHLVCCYIDKALKCRDTDTIRLEFVVRKPLKLKTNG